MGIQELRKGGLVLSQKFWPSTFYAQEFYAKKNRNLAKNRGSLNLSYRFMVLINYVILFDIYLPQGGVLF